MNGKRVEFQKSVKTCNGKLTKQPKKNIRTWSLFGRILDNFGTIFGHILRSRRHPKSESKREPIFECFFDRFWKPLGTPLLHFLMARHTKCQFPRTMSSKIIPPKKNVNEISNGQFVKTSFSRQNLPNKNFLMCSSSNKPNQCHEVGEVKAKGKSQEQCSTYICICIYLYHIRMKNVRRSIFMLLD